jgi:hypothetical protein
MRKLIVAASLILGIGSAQAADNYSATAGSGLTFAAKDSSGVLFTRFIGCDNTTTTQCWVVDSSGRLTVSVTSGSIAAGALASGAGVDGWDLTQGAKADAAWTTGSGSVISILKNIAGGSAGAVPAGTNLIGKVGIDQTTPGTTNAVQIPIGNVAVPLWGHGPVTPGTAATGTVLAGATYNSTAPTFTTGQQGPVQVSSRGGLLLGNGYPAGSTPITISGTGTTGATTATLATGASVTTYICGFSIRANATAAATGNATVTGTITGTLNFTQWTAPNASGLGVTEEIFQPCIPASAVNTGIAVISAAPSTGGVVSVTAWGYTL